MYSAKLTYERIVYLSKKKDVQISKINEICSINKDTLSASAKSKEGMKAKNLYNISKCLDCSVDYLLGRTDNPNAHTSDKLSSDKQQLLLMYDLLTDREQGEIIGELKVMTRGRVKDKNAETA